MKINILCVGNIKEDFYTQACNEYLKRLKKFHNVEVFEVAEEKLCKNPSQKDIEKVKVEETKRLEKLIKGHLVLLDVNGKSYSSEDFSEKIQKLQNTTSIITFVIGGSFGVSDDMKNKSQDKLSFSKFTFPHQLMRVVLLEQLYRASTIANNITYHK